ncbi:MAG: hypothetical protein K0R41_2333 [Geminicoccaceae bacterium]|nr:hypothetical protein [Geminicoccaceae bacterium]
MPGPRRFRRMHVSGDAARVIVIGVIVGQDVRPRLVRQERLWRHGMRSDWQLDRRRRRRSIDRTLGHTGELQQVGHGEVAAAAEIGNPSRVGPQVREPIALEQPSQHFADDDPADRTQMGTLGAQLRFL